MKKNRIDIDDVLTYNGENSLEISIEDGEKYELYFHEFNIGIEVRDQKHLKNILNSIRYISFNKKIKHET